MKKGAYLKENRSPEEYNKTRRLTVEDQQSRKSKRLRKQKRRKQLLVSIGVLLSLIIVLSIVAIIHHKSPLEGKWYMDEVTAYVFYNDGKGAMVLPSAEYEFTYSITDNNLSIDFNYEGAKDAQYIFTIEGNTLTLEGGNTTTQGTYVLNKSE